MKAVLRIMLMLFSLSIVSILLIQLPVAEASPIAVMSTSPASIVDPTLSPGSTFHINITIADVQKLHGYEFVLSYNTIVLTATDFGIYFPFVIILSLWSRIDDAQGNVYLAALTYLGDLEGLTTIDPKPIAWIEFTVDDLGSSDLDLHDSTLADIDGNPLAHSVVDGFFDNKPLVVMATADIDPDTLNLRSKGKWITAYIELPEGFDAADINATILMNETLSLVLDSKHGFVTTSNSYLVDHDNDGILERMVKFDRVMVQEFIFDQGIRLGNVALTLTGRLLDGTPFKGTDIIFVNYAG